MIDSWDAIESEGARVWARPRYRGTITAQTQALGVCVLGLQCVCVHWDILDIFLIQWKEAETHLSILFYSLWLIPLFLSYISYYIHLNSDESKLWQVCASPWC